MKTNRSITFALLLALASSAHAAIDLRVTEAWAGQAGTDITVDWFEITNLGSTAWTPAAGSLYYDDNSFSSAEADVISGLSDIQPGESVVVVIGTAGSATSFRSIWQGVISLAGVEIGHTAGANLGDDGDGVGIWLGGPSGAPTNQISFTAIGVSWDADLNAASFAGNASGAVSTGGATASPGRTASGGVVNSNAPVVTASASSRQLFNIAEGASGIVGGVIGDPTDRASTTGINFTLSDANTAVGSLVVTRTTSNATVVPLANAVLTGSGASRTLNITPAAVGTSNITVTVSDGALSDTYVINYSASAASSTPAISRYPVGSSDASAAMPISPGLMLVGNDEDERLRLYDRANSSQPISATDLRPALGVAKEVDIEAAVRVGNRIYWIGSHGNDRTGQDEPTRRNAFATDLTGSGSGTVPVYVNKYSGLRTDLIAWDNANGHGLGASALGLAASAAVPKLPVAADGFNIEGAALASNGSTVLLGFRAPLQTTANRNRALVIPATNLLTVIDNNSGPVTFGTPVFLDLGGRAIRSMDSNTSGQILILAGPVDERVTGIEANTFKLFLWDGNSANAPIPLTSSIDDIAANALASPECVFDMPSPLVNGSNVGVLCDSGSTVYYANAIEGKDLTPNLQKFRLDTVTLSGLPGVVSTNGDSGAGSLRQAIVDAPSGGTITFSPSLSGLTIPLTSGQLVIPKNLTIDATSLATGITISGEDTSRIFEISAGQTVILKGLTLREGFASDGGAVFNNGGILTVSGCTLLGNIAGRGAAIFSNTDLGSLKTTVVNSTITGNLATIIGGGIYNFDGLTEVRHCTITENGAPSGEGGGLASFGDSFTQTIVGSSIISGNAASDVDLVVSASNNSFASSGANLIGNGDALTGFIQTGDVTAAVPQLQPIARYGGPTETMPPRLGSPAINRATASLTTTDQRGAPRATADSGAVEFQPTVVTNSLDSGTGSLRAALSAPFASTVTFDAPTFNGELADTIPLATELTLNRSLIIDGSGTFGGVIVSGNNVTRVFEIGSSADVTLKSLSVVGGNSGNSNGGGIRVSGGAALTVIDSLIARNTNTDIGGGIMVITGTATVVNSTLAHNTANDGGAIWCQAGPATLRLTHTTVTENSGFYAIVNFQGMTLENSLVAGNTGNNIFDAAGSPVLVGNNLTSGDPRLLPLGNYSGGSHSMPPRPDSPAVNAAAVSSVSTDQRGAPRPAVSLPDIGAVEYQPAIVTNSANGGNDSLREVVNRSFVSTVFFDNSVFNGEPGDIITLTSSISLFRSMVFDASSNPRGVILSGNNVTRHFEMDARSDAVSFDSLSFTGGNATGYLAGEGGAILNEGGGLALNRCTLFGNTATFAGGAISSRGGSLALTQCTLSENSITTGGVNNGGGAIFNLGILDLTHCTVSGNTTATQNKGGGIINAGPATITNSIVAGNTVGPAGSGADILNDVGFVSGTVTRVGANLIQDYVQINGSTNSGPPAVTLSPLLGPLGDYGGKSRTVALMPGSPARNNSVDSDITTDQRGFATVGTPDIGAYEAGSTIVNYAAWSYETLPPGADYSFTADFEKDGRKNGIEYATHTDPLVFSGGSLPVFSTNLPRTFGFIQFPFRFGDTTLNYQIDRSTDLVTWTKVIEIIQGSAVYEGDGILYFTQDVSSLTFSDSFINGKEKVFYRLGVSPQ